MTASPSEDDLRHALSAYDQAIIRRAAATSRSAHLATLHAWFSTDLPVALARRRSESEQGATWLTSVQLGKVMEYKLARGKWRPRLVEFALSNPAELVKSATEAASLALLKDSEDDDDGVDATRALSALCKLKGVGPATATLIMTLLTDPLTFKADDDDNVQGREILQRGPRRREPFFSDESHAVVLPGQKIDYTVKAWRAWRESMMRRADEGGWEDAAQLERACWSWVWRGREGEQTSKEKRNSKSNKRQSAIKDDNEGDGKEAKQDDKLGKKPRRT